jgi:tetratricopeptide (TPR) repeat protein
MSPEEITEKALRAANRMYRAERLRVALDYAMEALDVAPRCYEALVLAGDLLSLTTSAAEFGLHEREAAQRAISYYDRAIQVQPDHAEAYAEKLVPLLDLGEHQAAIECADQGLALFDIRPTTDCPAEVWTNIGESLYGRKSLALKNSDRTAEGRRVLEEGLSRFPGSWYLTQIVDEFLPDS